MTDPRIIQYRQAAQNMALGKFQVTVPARGDDEVARLGKALIDLGAMLEKKFEEIKTLTKVTERVNAGLVLDDVLAEVFNSFRPIIPYDRIGFSLLEDHGKIVKARWVKSDSPQIKIKNGYAAPLKGSSLHRIIETGQARIINDLPAYLEKHPGSDSTKKIVAEGMKSSLTCPLIALGKPIGFLFFSSMKAGTYKNVHPEIFLQIAGQLSVIVEKGRLYQELLELNNMKNKFLGIVAHDLRNPMDVLRSYLSLFLDGLLGNISDAQKEVMEEMMSTSESVLALLNDLLDFRAIESGRLAIRPDRVNLEAFLLDFLSYSKLLASAKSIDLNLQINSPIPHFVTDVRRVKQVITNLVSNAIKFSYSGSEITIKSQVVDHEVHISVIDEGQGIPATELPSLFIEFGKASPRPTAGERSTGLGLAIAKRVIEALGGRIWVVSEVGRGSTFTFSLPLQN